LARRAYPSDDSKLVGILAEAFPDADIRLRLREFRHQDISGVEIHAVRLDIHRLADRQRSRPSRSVCKTASEAKHAEGEINKNDANSVLKGFKEELSSLTKEIRNLVKLQKQGDRHDNSAQNRRTNQSYSNNSQGHGNYHGVNQNRRWTDRNYQGLDKSWFRKCKRCKQPGKLELVAVGGHSSTDLERLKSENLAANWVEKCMLDAGTKENNNLNETKLSEQVKGALRPSNVPQSPG